MVATDGTTIWDLKPNRENANQLFNILCNVVPTPHPWIGEGYRRQIDMNAGEKQLYRFEKCKGLKKCPIYQYECSGERIIDNNVETDPGDGSQGGWTGGGGDGATTGGGDNGDSPNTPDGGRDSERQDGTGESNPGVGSGSGYTVPITNIDGLKNDNIVDVAGMTIVINGKQYPYVYQDTGSGRKLIVYDADRTYYVYKKDGNIILKEVDDAIQEEISYGTYQMKRENPKDPQELAWRNSNFTDVILFQNYKIYMRKSSMLLNSYGRRADPGYVDSGSDGNMNTCDEGSRPSNLAKKREPDPSLVDKDVLIEEYGGDGQGKFESTYTSSERIRIYIQQVDTKHCSGDSFDSADESPIILVKEYAAAPCNPDKFIRGSGGIGVPRVSCNGKVRIAIIYKEGQHFAYIYGKDLSISPTEVVYLPEQGIYLSGLYSPKGEENDILTGVSLPLGGYFIPEVSELMQLFKIPQVDPRSGILTDTEITELNEPIKIFQEYGEIPYLAAGGKLIAIHGVYSAMSCHIPRDCKVWDEIEQSKIRNPKACQARDPQGSHTRMFLYDSTVMSATNKYPITGLSAWGSRLAYIANSTLYVSGNGRMQGVFGADLSAQGDATRGPKAIPSGLTDLKEMYGSLLLFGPKAIHAIKDEAMLKAGIYLKASDNEDGYYGPGSYYNDDGEFLIVRRGKVLETMEYSAYYGTIQFKPDTGFFVNSHIKGCDQEFDKINIDATINHRYISIFDNYDEPRRPHRSKLLIYDKHYNVWYHWMIVGARVIHVRDGIFLGDSIYVNEGRTWGWEVDDTEGGEIIQIISAFVGEEGLQSPKHIQYVKTAIGNRSRITKDSKWSIGTSLGGKYSERRVDITTTRHPQLLDLKERNDIIKAYNSGETISGHGQLLEHTLGNEFDEYINYSKYDTPINRQLSSMDDLNTTLARFASIKEPVNVPANIIQLSISSRYLDSVQFGSFFIAYYMNDADFEDLENTNMDISDYGDTTSPNNIDINKGEYCDEVLKGSACDVSYDDTILDRNP